MQKDNLQCAASLMLLFVRSFYSPASPFGSCDYHKRHIWEITKTTKSSPMFALLFSRLKMDYDASDIDVFHLQRKHRKAHKIR